jgi:hypothetical protein
MCAASVIAGVAGAALADYRIRNDYGGFIHKYKLKYAAIRDRGERVIIDGVCNSACTLVLGIVPLNRICVTPARLTFPLSVNRCADASAGAPIVLLLWRALHDWIGDRRQCIGGHRRRTGAFLDFNKHGLRNRRLCKS